MLTVSTIVVNQGLGDHFGNIVLGGRLSACSCLAALAMVLASLVGLRLNFSGVQTLTLLTD